MGLITKNVKIRAIGKNIPYYRNLGYNFKNGDEIEIMISDLPKGSNIQVECSCDYCGKSFNLLYFDYNRVMSSAIPKIVCNDCLYIKQKEGLKLKYGVENASLIPEVREKVRKTVNERFGCDNVFQSKEIKERIKKQNIELYGVENTNQREDIKIKNAKKMYENNTGKTSVQQKYLHNLFGGELNYPIKYYLGDIVFINEKICIEYDGSGHSLNIVYGSITESEFKQKEIIRDNIFKREGYRIIRIISRKDYLPSDEILLSMLQYARDFFSQNPDRSWISFDIDNSCIYNAYYKESSSGLPYDYGKLRKIKKEHLSSHPSQTLSQPSAQ